MSRSSLLTSALAVLALGAGALGYAATGQAGEEMRLVGPERSARLLPASVEPRRAADRTVVVGEREALAAALLRAGVGGLDAALAAEAGGSASGRVDMWLGEQVGPGARALERLAVRTGPGRTLVVERENNGFVRRDLVEAVDLTPVRIRLDAGAGLAAGLVEARLPRVIRDQVLDCVAGERVAAIDLIIAHEATASGSHYGQPLYLGEHLADGSIRRWVGEGGQLRSFGSGEEPPAALLRPLPGPITSSPGLRFHPILRFLRWHRGTDFASPSGTPVQAALAGRVIEAGWRGGYGRAVRVAHGDSSTTLYAHLSQIEVAAGQPIFRGAVVGKVGSSGLATGPHLHFEWQRGGATLHPTFGGGQIAGATAAPAQRAALQALLSAPFRLPPDRRW